MLKISTRLTLWYLIATGSVIIIIAVLLYYLYEIERKKAIDSDLKDYANFLVSEMGGESATLSEVYERLLLAKKKQTAKPINNRFILSSNDSVIYEGTSIFNIDSLIDVLEHTKEFSFKEAYNTIKYNGIEFRTYSSPIDTRRFSKRFQKAGFKDLRLTVFTPMNKFYESINQLQTVMMLVVPASIFFSGLIGLFIARRALSPVKTITDTVSAITTENLELRVPRPKSNDELGQLVDTFNDMINRLDNTFKIQKRFIADASHDIRTPLTIIQMELELLLNRDTVSQSTKAVIDKCYKETISLSQLAENLMLLARADSNQLKLDKQLFRLDELLIDTVSSFNKLAQSKHINFQIDIGNEEIKYYGDENLIKRALNNLLDNAIKFSDDDSIINCKLEQHANDIILIVNNRGPIISSETLPYIFDRFRRGDQSRTTKGFGLGLSIVYAIVTEHGGEINVQSDETLGTSFAIHLFKSEIEE